MSRMLRKPAALFRWILLASFIGLIPLSQAEESAPLADVAKDYFDTYAARQDFTRFIDFYASDAAVVDVIGNDKVQGVEAIAAFFDWRRGDFQRAIEGPILIVTHQLISGNTVITRGQFNAFVYNGEPLGPWDFLIWQVYDDAQQIQQQHDWINYTPGKTILGDKPAP